MHLQSTFKNKVIPSYIQLHMRYTSTPNYYLSVAQTVNPRVYSYTYHLLNVCAFIEKLEEHYRFMIPCLSPQAQRHAIKLHNCVQNTDG